MAESNGDRPQRPPYRAGRDALLDATVRVVAEHGLRGLTYRRVAEAAHTTHGLVSYHFGSREALIEAAVEKACREAIAKSLLDPPTDRVDEFLRTLPEVVDNDADSHAFQLELALESRRSPALSPEVRSTYEQYLAVTRRALEAIGLEADREAAARLVFAVIDGLTIQQLIFGNLEDTRAAVRLLQEVLVRLGAEEPA